MFWVRQGGGGGPRDETHIHKTAGWYHAALAFFHSAECSADIISGLSKTPPNNLRHMHAPDGRPLATRNACRGAMCLSSGWPKNCGKDTATVAPSPPMVWRRKRWKRNKHPPSEEESTGNIVQQSKLDFCGQPCEERGTNVPPKLQQYQLLCRAARGSKPVLDRRRTRTPSCAHYACLHESEHSSSAKGHPCSLD